MAYVPVMNKLKSLGGKPTLRMATKKVNQTTRVIIVSMISFNGIQTAIVPKLLSKVCNDEY